MDNAKLLYLKVENQNFQILMVSVTHCVMDSQWCGKSIQLAYAGLADQWPVSKKLGPFFLCRLVHSGRDDLCRCSERKERKERTGCERKESKKRKEHPKGERKKLLSSVLFF